MKKSLLFLAMGAFVASSFAQMQNAPKQNFNKPVNVFANKGVESSNRGINTTVATLTYSSDVVATNLGYGSPYTLTAVAQFPATTMATYNGNMINKVSIGVSPSYFTGDVVVKIWTDTANFGATPAVTQSVAASSLIDGWNEILLTTPFSIDGSQIWVGYTCNSTDYGMYMDNQAAESNGYGDLFCDGTSWANTSGYGASFDHNFQIKAIVDDGNDYEDLTVTSVSMPSWNCDLGASEAITAVVKNNGTLNLTAATDLSYLFNGVVSTVAIPTPLAAGASVNVNFNLDLSADGVYQLKAYTTLGTDVNLANDTASSATVNTVPNDVPMSVLFDLATYDFMGWNTEDINADESTWGLYQDATEAHTGDLFYRYDYSGSNAANDYVYSNCINLTAGLTYELKFWSKVAGATFPENLEVKLGQGQVAANMTQSIVDLVGLTDIAWVEHTANFTVAADGVYNLGFYAHSDADMYSLFLDDVSIDNVTYVNQVSKNNISVYPNPSNGLVTINGVEKASVNVYNTLGALVMSANNVNSIDMSALANGTYMVKVTTANESVVKQVVLTK
jgi:hypothetical protein